LTVTDKGQQRFARALSVSCIALGQKFVHQQKCRTLHLKLFFNPVCKSAQCWMVALIKRL